MAESSCFYQLFMAVVVMLVINVVDKKRSYGEQITR